MLLEDINTDCLRIIYRKLDDKSFVKLTQTNKYFNSQSNLKRLRKYYNIIRIFHVISKYIFNNIICNNKLYLDQIPNNINRIKFGRNFNEEIFKLPNQIKEIEFGYSFNQSVENLPTSLVTLKFGCNFNHNIDNLPNSIKKLILGYKFNQEVNKWPDSLTYLKLERFDNCGILCSNLPDSITYLEYRNIEFLIEKWPSELKILKVNNYSFINRRRGILNPFKLPNLPSLKNLEITLLDEDLNISNNQITSLKIKDEVSKFHYIPDTVTYLDLRVCSIYDLNFSKLNSLIWLRLPDTFNKKITFLPETLKYLILGNEFNQEIDWPKSLKYLSVGPCYDKIIELPNVKIVYRNDIMDTILF